jgi:hypothetical protein
MNNQKDTQKTGLNIYGQPDASGSNSHADKPVYEFVNKKTEKLVTALYMVTDCMDSDDALKGKLRLLGVELLSDMYKLSTLSPVDKHTHISVSLAHIYEALSFIEIACTIGFISEMNTSILKREFELLVLELESHKSKGKHFTFTLDKKMFDVERDPSRVLESRGIKDKRTQYNMSFINSQNNSNLSLTKRFPSGQSSMPDKKVRTDKILAIIKDKKGLPSGEAAVSIKDISSAFTDCSEKTIQRELNSLVSKGQITKIGAKRWSRYQSI